MVRIGGEVRVVFEGKIGEIYGGGSELGNSELVDIVNDVVGKCVYG